MFFLLVKFLTKWNWYGIKSVSKKNDKNRINIKNDGNETAEEAKSDNDISTKLPIAKY